MSGKIGNKIPQVTIGTQTWMLYNLSTTTYRNGDPILTSVSANGQSSNDSIYGRQYDWATVTDLRGIAPKGWHVASQAEWTTLRDYVNNTLAGINTLKSTTLWSTTSGNGTNTTGFTMVPAGINGTLYFGDRAAYWTSTSSTSTNAVWVQVIITATISSQAKINKFSVRCIKDY